MKKLGTLIFLWLLFSATGAILGLFRPPDGRLPLLLLLGVFGPPLVVAILLGRSKSAQEFVRRISMTWLIGIQLYRVLGVNFLFLADQGKLPNQFALPAGYGDILIGITAPFVAHLMRSGRPNAKTMAAIWNLAGILDLLMAVGLGVTSAPGPLRLFLNEPSTEIMALFPLALIPTFLVPLSLSLHVASLFQLLSQRGSQATMSRESA